VLSLCVSFKSTLLFRGFNYDIDFDFCESSYGYSNAAFVTLGASGASAVVLSLDDGHSPSHRVSGIANFNYDENGNVRHQHVYYSHHDRELTYTDVHSARDLCDSRCYSNIANANDHFLNHYGSGISNSNYDENEFVRHQTINYNHHGDDLLSTGVLPIRELPYCAAFAALSAYSAWCARRAYGARRILSPGKVTNAARSSVVLLILVCLVGSVGAADTLNNNQVQKSVNGFFPPAANPAAPYQRHAQHPQPTTTYDRESHLNTHAPELRTIFWNCDGVSEKGVVLEEAMNAHASIVLLTDTRMDNRGASWEHSVKKVWGKNCFVRSCTGLERFDGTMIGGCAVAVRGGWVNRCKGVIDDKRGWGRYMVLKLSGSTNIWLTVCYFAYRNDDRESSSYMELQRKAMGDINSDKNSNEHMPVTDGRFDSQKLLCRDLEELKVQAEASNAEIVIAGDFNEQYSHGTDRRLHNWMDNVMMMKNVLHNGKDKGNETCFSKEGGTDIDWICATQKVADPSRHRCWIHEFSIGGAHRPTHLP
jgi:hypothetical protein